MIHHKIHHNVASISKEWDSLAVHDILLQSKYLKAFEEASPGNIKLYFVEVFNESSLVGLAVIQHVQLYLKDMFRDTKVSCFKEFLKQNLSKVLKGNILVIGNLTHTGQHGICFNSEKISINQFYSELFNATLELKKQIKKEKGKTLRIIMMKDFFQDDKLLNTNFLIKEKLHKVKVQPNMMLNTRTHWETNEDYVAAMTKKYRTRFKRAKKKLNGIVHREMDLETIKANSKRLHQLYLNVSKNAKFNTFILPENHFYSYKYHLKDNFKVYGYFLDNEIVGFYTLILNNNDLETYFLGYATAHQYKNQLYLNMLYDMVNFGISNKFKTVVYARTAMAIKSSVGAKPKDMIIYLKHTNRVINLILRQIFKLMDPTQDWEERHPFKNE